MGYVQKLPSFRDSSKIKKLISRFNSSKINRSDIDFAIRKVNYSSFDDKSDTLAKLIIGVMITSSNQRKNILESLRLYPGNKLFDPYLADLISSFPRDTEKTKYILKIVSIAGKEICQSHLCYLLDEARAKNAVEITFDTEEERNLAWNSLFDLNKTTAVQLILKYYSNPSRELSAPSTALMSSLLKRLQSDRWKSISVLDDMNRFIDGLLNRQTLKKTTMAKDNYATSKIEIIITKWLISINGPLAQSLILKLNGFSNVSLNNIIKHTNFSLLQKYPELMNYYPELTGSKPPGREWETLRKLHYTLDARYLMNYDQSSSYFRFINFGLNNHLIPSKNIVIDTSNISLQSNYDLLYSTISRLKELYNLKYSNLHSSIQKCVAEGAISTEYSKYRSYEYNQSLVDGLIQQGLISSQVTTADLKRTLSLISNDEQERLSLVNYSILSYSQTLNKSIKDFSIGNADEVLDNLEKTRSQRFIYSTVVSSIQPKKQSTEKLDHLQIKSIVIKLISRKYDFNQGIFEEELMIKYVGGQQTIFYYGPIPIFLLNALRRHPRLLDFSMYSLFQREMTLSRSTLNTLESDPDLVNLFPAISIPYLQYGISHLQVPWKFIRDNLIVETIRQKQLFRPKGSPLPNAAEINKYPESQVTKSNGDFDKISGSLIGDFTDLMTGKIGSNIVSQIRNSILPRLEDKTVWVHYTVPDRQPDGTVIYRDAYTTKTYYYKTNFDRISGARLNGYQQKANTNSYFDLSNISPSDIKYISPVKVYADSDCTNFISIYKLSLANGSKKYAIIKGSLENIRSLVKNIFNIDNSFLEKYPDIDFAGIYKEAFPILYRIYLDEIDKSLGSPMMSGILNKYGIDQDYYYGIATNDIAISPFLNSTESKTTRIKSILFNSVRSFFTSASTDSFTINKDAEKYFTDNWSKIQYSADSIANTIASQKIAEFNRELDKADHNWSIYISYSWAGPLSSLGLNFSYDNFSINFATNFDNKIFINGSWNSIPVPFSYTFDFNSPIPSEGVKNFTDLENSTNSSEASLQEYIPTQMTSVGSYYHLKDIRAPLTKPILINSRTSVSSAAALSITAPDVSFYAVGDYPVSWYLLPSNTPYSKKDDPIAREWLSGLIARSFSSLTDLEKSELRKQINTGQITNNMYETLVTKGKRFQAQRNNSGTKWIRTDTVNELIPFFQPGSEIPPGYDKHLPPSQNIDEFIKNTNKSYENNFLAACKQKGAELKGNGFFEDGLPAVKLTYGNDFKIMKFDYSYRLKEGGDIRRIVYYKSENLIPPNIIAKIKVHPNDHIWEKWSTAVVARYVNTAAFAGSDMLQRQVGEYRTDFHDYVNLVNSPAEQPSTEIITSYLSGMEYYIAQMSAWANNMLKLGYINEPLLLNPFAIPLFNFFTPPYELAERINETVTNELVFQKNSFFYEELRTGGINVSDKNTNVLRDEAYSKYFAAKKFRSVVPKILKAEGGYVNNKNDPGGETNKGITMRTFKRYASDLLSIEPSSQNLKKITDEQASVIYYFGYWSAIKGDRIKDAELAHQIMDFYINAGGNAIRQLNKTLQSMDFDVKVRTSINERTLEAIDKADAKKLCEKFKAARIEYYKRISKNNSKGQFLNGWLKRAQSFNCQ